jgi:peptidoglycan hydrolase-like protein with peptidoglycan-binding domain
VQALIGAAPVQRECSGPAGGCACGPCSSGKEDDDTERAGDPKVQRAGPQPPAGRPVVQRQQQSGARVDVAFVLDQSGDNMIEASSLAPGQTFRTLTKQAFTAKLKELSDANVSIGTLFIISHSAIGSGISQDEGVVFFEPTKGKLQKVTLAELAAAVKATLPNGMSGKPTTIAFRGCRIGGASKSSLDAFRLSVGAGVAHGTNCKTVIRTTGKITVGGRLIRSDSDLKTAEQRRVFDEEFEKMVKGFEDGFGNSVRNCIVGLNRGELALSSLPKLKRIYFQNKGELAAVWTNPHGNAEKDPRDPGCKCMNELEVGKGTCRLEQVPSPPTPGKPGGKTTCVPAGGPVFALASFTQPAGPAVAAAPLVESDLVGLTRGDGLAVGTFDRRPRVERLQSRLNERGGTLAADGMFGEQTATALHQLQARLGLPEQDTVDPASATALEGEPTPETQLSSLEGLRQQDGITFGTWHLRPRVTELQQRLTGHGFFAEPDGMFGNDTLAALNAFQSGHELTPSTVVDRETADALEGRGTPAPCPPGEIRVAEPELTEV